MKTMFAVAVMLLTLLAGCTSEPAKTGDDCWKTAKPELGAGSVATTPALPGHDPKAAYQSLGFTGRDVKGTDDAAWPDLTGQTLTILDHGAFSYAFDEAAAGFEALTHAHVEHIESQDAGTMLNEAILEKEKPSFDIIYGLDNVLLSQAINAGILSPYHPVLANRIATRAILAEGESPWFATPVDQGYIAINVDPRDEAALGSLSDLVPRADQFVTEDPRTSSPGLGFLVSTVATYGEDCYLGYWKALFDNGALVTLDWTTAYTTHFTGGYGQFEEGFAGKRAIVTSYTSSPAYEVYYGAETLNTVLTAPGATFHQVETMAIPRGAAHRAAAEAWIEYTLTDTFQELLARDLAVYPVVTTMDVSPVFGHKDPMPGSFQDAGFTSLQLGRDVPRWVHDWADLYEAHQAG